MAIISRLENSVVNLSSEMNAYGQRMIELCNESESNLNPEEIRRVELLGNQLISKSSSGHQHYDSCDIKDALELYLRSRSCYRAAEKLLFLPNEKTIRSYFGKIGSHTTRINHLDKILGKWVFYLCFLNKCTQLSFLISPS